MAEVSKQAAIGPGALPPDIEWPVPFGGWSPYREMFWDAVEAHKAGSADPSAEVGVADLGKGHGWGTDRQIVWAIRKEENDLLLMRRLSSRHLMRQGLVGGLKGLHELWGSLTVDNDEELVYRLSAAGNNKLALEADLSGYWLDTIMGLPDSEVRQSFPSLVSCLEEGKEGAVHAYFTQPPSPHPLTSEDEGEIPQSYKIGLRLSVTFDALDQAASEGDPDESTQQLMQRLLASSQVTAALAKLDRAQFGYKADIWRYEQVKTASERHMQTAQAIGAGALVFGARLAIRAIGGRDDGIDLSGMLSNLGISLPDINLHHADIGNIEPNLDPTAASGDQLSFAGSMKVDLDNGNPLYSTNGTPYSDGTYFYERWIDRLHHSSPLKLGPDGNLHPA